MDHILSYMVANSSCLLLNSHAKITAFAGDSWVRCIIHLLINDRRSDLIDERNLQDHRRTIKESSLSDRPHSLIQRYDFRNLKYLMRMFDVSHDHHIKLWLVDDRVGNKAIPRQSSSIKFVQSPFENCCDFNCSIERLYLGLT